jgi:thiol-disulfide isomerase/thioredoxin
MRSAKLRPVRLLAVALAGLALVACNSEESSEPASPGPDQFLEGGRKEFEAYVAQQRGTPVVVNKWASWCGPCRYEFPFFGNQAKKREDQVVFVGLNSNDNRGDAEEFLREFPVPFRHFEDPRSEVAASFNAAQAFPATAFYDSKGELAFVHQGGYASEAKLAEDIDRYAR